eukprot:95136_1
MPLQDKGPKCGTNVRVDMLDVKWVMWAEWKRDMAKIAKHKKFLARHKALSDYCSEGHLWITMNMRRDSHLLMVMSKGLYLSNAMEERYVNRAYGFHPDKRFYFYIQFLEELKTYGGDFTSRMEVRCSLTGHKGELMWLHRGYRVCGNKLLEVYNILAETLRIRTTYLYDDAKITLPVNIEKRQKNAAATSKKRVSVEPRKIYLRQFLPIANDSALTWYEHHSSYSLWKIVDCSAIHIEFLFSQSPDDLRAAIKLVRATRLADLRTAYGRFRNAVRLLDEVEAAYFKEKRGRKAKSTSVVKKGRKAKSATVVKKGRKAKSATVVKKGRKAKSATVGKKGRKAISVTVGKKRKRSVSKSKPARPAKRRRNTISSNTRSQIDPSEHKGPGTTGSTASPDFGDYTVHDLTRRICARCRDKSLTDKGRREANTHLYKFVEQFLTPHKHKQRVLSRNNKSKVIERNYVRALRVIYDAYIFVRQRDDG